MKKSVTILLALFTLLLIGCSQNVIDKEEQQPIEYDEEKSYTFTTKQNLTIFNEIPYLLSDGVIFEYQGASEWKKIESDVAVKRIFDGEIPCALDLDGKVICEVLPKQEDNLPLSSAYAYDMATQLLKINEEQKFLCLGDNLLVSPIALLDGNILLYPREGQYETYQMEEEVQMLAGNYVLSKSGNIYRIASEEPDWDENIVRSVYSGEDIIVIAVDQNSGLCIGLTNRGDVLCVEHNSVRAENVKEKLSSWSDIVNIAVSDTTVCGVKANAECIEIQY